MPARIESLDELRAMLGQEAGVSEWFTVTQELINQFAALTGDEQWIHIDPERARRESPYQTTVAHGFLTVSLLSRLVAQAVTVGGHSKMRVNYGFDRVRFPTPVPSGSRIRAHVTPKSIKDVEGGVELNWQVTVEAEGQQKPALAAEWLTRIYF